MHDLLQKIQQDVSFRTKVLKWTGIGFATALLTFGLMLWLIGFRPSAGQVEAGVEIDRITLQVWPWVAEPELQKQWIGGLVEVRQKSPQQVVWVMSDGGDSRMEIQGEITERTMPVVLKMNVHAPGDFSGVSEFRVVELAAGRTKVEMLGQYRYDSWFYRLLEPLITPRAIEKTKQDLLRLKQKMETNP